MKSSDWAVPALIALAALALGCRDATEPARPDAPDGPASLFAPSIVTTIYTGGTLPAYLALDSRLDRLFVTDAPRGTRLTVINAAADAVITDVFQGGNAGRTALNPNTHRLYVPLANSARKLRIFDTNVLPPTSLGDVTMGGVTDAAGVNGSTGKIYVAWRSALGPMVSVLDGSTHAISRTIGPIGPADNVARAVGVNPNRNRIYITSAGPFSAGQDELVVIDGATDAVTATIRLPTTSSPLDVAVNPATNLIYVPERLGNRVFVIDGASNTISASITLSASQVETVGARPSGNLNRVYATTRSPHMFHIVNGATNAVCHTIDLAPFDSFNDIEVDPASDRIYLNDQRNAQVLVIEDEGADFDRDGIENEIDSSPLDSNFDDRTLSGGTTWGSIEARDGQQVCVTEEPNPSGIRVRTDVASGPVPVLVNLCGITVVAFPAGTEAVETCSSAILEVVTGPIEATFYGNDGREATTTLDSGNTLTFDEVDFTFTADPDNTATIAVEVEGVEFRVAPGETLEGPYNIDIRPESDTNPINADSKGLIPVAVLTTDLFDASSVDPASVTLGNDDADDTPVAQKRGKSGNLMVEVADVDFDGDSDLVLYFQTQALIENGDLTAATTVLYLNGLVDGTPFRDADRVTVVM